MLTLDVAISTWKESGIRRVASMCLPVIQGVRYVVSWQCHGGAVVPAELDRPDVEIYRFDKLGQSHNRNNALEHCRGDIVLMADDDLIYSEERLKRVVGCFEQNPGVDVATFRSVHFGSPVVYPQESCRLTSRLPKGYSVGCIEIAIRRRTAGHLRFNTEMGLGSPKLHGGEDEMFLYSAIKRGLNCRFFPVTICEHPYPSTGTKARYTVENLRSHGCVIGLMYPWTSVLRVPLKAWRLSRCGQSSLIKGLIYVAQGALMSIGVLRRGHDTLW